MNDNVVNANINITGTLIWYYYICKREVWLMSRSLEAEQDNVAIEIGRLIHEEAYKREKKEIHLENAVFDILSGKGEKLVIGEIKKSSRFKESSQMQLAFYLKKLEDMGVDAIGELRFPEERKRETISLTDDLRQELEKASGEIEQIVLQEKPPAPQKTKYCRGCAYQDFCWV